MLVIDRVNIIDWYTNMADICNTFVFKLTFPCEPEDCQHCSLPSIKREAWFTEDDTFKFLTILDQSSSSMPRWLLWCLFSCFPERPQNTGDWPGVESWKIAILIQQYKCSTVEILKTRKLYSSNYNYTYPPLYSFVHNFTQPKSWLVWSYDTTYLVHYKN